MKITNLGNENMPYKLGNVLYHLERFCNENPFGRILELKKHLETTDVSNLIDDFGPDNILRSILFEIFENDKFSEISKNMDYKGFERKSLVDFFRNFKNDYFEHTTEYQEFFDELLQANLDDLVIEPEVKEGNSDSVSKLVTEKLEGPDKLITEYHNLMMEESNVNVFEYVLNIADFFLNQNHGWDERDKFVLLKWGLSNMVEDRLFTSGTEMTADFWNTPNYNLTKEDFFKSLEQYLKTNDKFKFDFYDITDILMEVFDYDDEENIKYNTLADLNNLFLPYISNLNEGEKAFFWKSFNEPLEPVISRNYNFLDIEDIKPGASFNLFIIEADGSGFKIVEYNVNDDYSYSLWDDSVYIYEDGLFTEVVGYTDERADLNNDGWGISEQLKEILELQNELTSVRISNFELSSQTLGEDNSYIYGSFSFNDGPEYITGEYTYNKEIPDDNVSNVTIENMSDERYANFYNDDDDFFRDINGFISDNIDEDLFNEDEYEVEINTFDITNQYLDEADKSMDSVLDAIQGSFRFTLEGDDNKYTGEFKFYKDDTSEIFDIVNEDDILFDFDENAIETLSTELDKQVDKSLFVNFLEVTNEDIENFIRTEIATDFQFDKNDENYLGFLNTGIDVYNDNGDNKSEYFNEIWNNLDYWDNWCKENVGLTLDGSTGPEEIIFSEVGRDNTADKSILISGINTFLNNTDYPDYHVALSYPFGNCGSVLNISREQLESMFNELKENDDLLDSFELMSEEGPGFRGTLDKETMFHKLMNNATNDNVQGYEKYKIFLSIAVNSEGLVDRTLELMVWINADVHSLLEQYLQDEPEEESIQEVDLKTMKTTINKMLEEFNAKNFPNRKVDFYYPVGNCESTKILPVQKIQDFFFELFDNEEWSLELQKVVNDYAMNSLTPDYVDLNQFFSNVLDKIHNDDEAGDIVYITFPYNYNFNGETVDLKLKISIGADMYGWIYDNLL